MAKDLPYFKFFCSEWTDGDITLESYEVQGVFINVCSYYWSNECDVSYSKLIKKFKDCIDSIDILENAGIIKIEANDEFYINFLNEQSTERRRKSKVNSKNGAKGGRPKNPTKNPTKSENKPNALNSLSETKGNKKRREEKREEKKEEVAPPKVDGFDFSKLLEFINKSFGRNFKTISKTIKAKYNARLKDGYTKDDIFNAIVNCSNDKFHKDLNFKHCTPSYFSRANTIDLHSAVKEVNKPYKSNEDKLYENVMIQIQNDLNKNHAS